MARPTNLAFKPVDEVVARPGAGRPLPPEDIGDAEKVLWRMTVEAMPSGWFGRESWPMLAAYCYHAVRGRRYQRMADECTDVNELNKLTQIVARESNAMGNMASRLRINPQVRVSQQNATGAIKNSPREGVPWRDHASD